MKDLVIYGSGGMALEVVQLIEDINEIKPEWNILGYIDDVKGDQGENNPVVNDYKVLGTRSIVKDFDPSVYWIIAVSNPKFRKDIYDSLKCYNLKYATLIHPTAKISKNVTIGEGTVVSYGCILSVNVALGKQIYLNMRTVIGHDTVIRDFSTCLIDCIVAGNVLIKEGVLLGSNCVIREKKTIGARSKISMGATVFFDVEDDVVVMNSPPKSMKFSHD
jgi:sugar O-acyltransferase (sialic acid O-acetyltransferase NeuD family)